MTWHPFEGALGSLSQNECSQTLLYKEYACFIYIAICTCCKQKAQISTSLHIQMQSINLVSFGPAPAASMNHLEWMN